MRAISWRLTMRRFLLTAVLCGIALSTCGARITMAQTGGGKGWDEVKKLTDEQKYEAAAKKVTEILAEAKAAKDESQWTKALVTSVQLRMSLDGYETAVRFLKDEPWPQGALPQATLQLYYAQTLMTYLQSYNWEIRQRERVETKATVDLKAWTMDQIYAEANKAYDSVWQKRAGLGNEPVGILKEHVEPNNYPAHIRGTLRDAVTYLYVGQLSQSSYWTPEEGAQKYLLNVPKLIEGTDTSTHPLARAGALLKDLEGWHASANRGEAALEARLARLRLAHQNMTDDRPAIVAAVESALKDKRSLPWWAMGMADLAGFARDAGDLVKAHALVKSGAEAYPKDVGGDSCRAIMETIEAPDFQLSGMLVDGASQRSLLVTHKNLGKIHFRAWPVDLVKHVESSQDYNLLPAWEEYQRLGKSKPAETWSIDLPPTPDFQQHKTYVTPPLSKSGLWVIAASARDDFSEQDNRTLAVNFVQTDLVVVSRREGSGDLEVSVVSGKTGEPVAGADVWLYKFDYGKKHKVYDAKKTDAKGLVRFKASARSYASHFIVAKKGGEVSIDPDHQYLSEDAEPNEHVASFVYTDRSIYRPQQKLFWKVVAYRGHRSRADYKAAAGQPVVMSLRDANYEVVATVTAKTNEFGTAAGEFTIPAGRLLGAWQVQSSWSGQASVRVEEYKRPTFEVTLKDADEALRLNRDAVIKGEARYYFGLPVASGSVKWRVKRVPVYPYWWFWYWGGGDGGSRELTVANGVSAVKEDGSFELRFNPAVDERQAATPAGKGVTYRYSVEADLTDEGGETRSASRSFRLGFVAIEATLNQDAAFSLAGVKGEMKVIRTNLDGAPQTGVGTYRIVTLKQPSAAQLPADVPLPQPPPEPGQQEPYRTPGDALRERWVSDYQPERAMAAWADGDEKGRGELKHDDKGVATLALPELSAGAYRVRYETKDEFGATFETFKDFFVAGERMPLMLPALLLVEQGSTEVGGKARVIAHSGLANQQAILSIYKDGRLKDRRVLQSDSAAALIEFPITEADRGGFGLTLTLVRDHQLIQIARTVNVPWTNKQLKISYETFRDKLRPGQKEAWRVKVTGPNAEAAAAEILAYMYDKSLDAFAPHATPSPISLFPARTGLSWSRANLKQTYGQRSNHGDFSPPGSGPHLHGDTLRFFDSYGIGGPGGRRHYAKKSRARATESMRQEAGLALDEGAADLEAPTASSPARANAAPPPAGAPMGELAKSKDKADDAKPGQAESGANEEPVRSNFAETAFFKPQLLAGKDGVVTLEFETPDSVTAWNVWIHAIAKDLSSASLKREVRTVKELMVRPYLPRFLREGDKASLKVVINNAGEKELAGKLVLDIIDPETDKSVAALFGLTDGSRTFTVKPGGGSNVSFLLVAPKRVGVYAFKVTATAGDFADGERRPLPLLPSRMHLAQSRFVTLRDKERREMHFQDMAKGDDPTLVNEQLVVTVDAQLFYGVLKSLPYLVRYPYECTEQTMNRFVSAGIVSTVFRDFPAVAAMAKQMSKRDTQYESFDQLDPNRKLTLEESPWLEASRGGSNRHDHELANMLEPSTVKLERDAALAKLKKAQTSLGGFPWFAGGPPSPYITLYLMHGFAKATEFGVDVPKDMVVKGWQYLARHFREDYVKLMREKDCCWEWLTFLNYVASAYPDPSWTAGALTPKEREEILAFSFKHWKQHSPYLKGYLALTLKRAGRAKDAKLVWDSVMDSAKTEKDQGTFWAQEDRSWLWYNDTIETHAFALRTMMEMEPEDKRKDGLVLWLFLNKKLNHWKSTKATAEVIYSLVHYLKADKSLGVKEVADLAIGAQKQTLTFEPDKYVGRTQVVVPGEQLDPKTQNTVVIEKDTKGVMFASATWHFATDKLPDEARGDFFSVTRRYFLREKSGSNVTLKPLEEGATLEPGDEVEVQLSLRSKHEAEYVHLRDPRAAGLEPDTTVSRYKYDLGLYWYEEVRDSGTNFFFERLPVGEYTFKYRVRANMGGVFRVGPATVQSMYAPEFAAYSAGNVLEVK